MLKNNQTPHYLLLTLISANLWGCGAKEANPESPEASQSVPNGFSNRQRKVEKALENPEGRMSVEGGELVWSHLEPEKAGGAWRRVFQLRVADPSNWSVSKKSAKQSGLVGKTNAEGFFIDSEINQQISYTFGETIVTEAFAARSDWILDERLCQTQGEIKAFRVVVPEGQNIKVSHCHLILRADWVLLEGSLELDSSGASNNLVILTPKLEGDGKIIL
jgi:hypothetical protein